MSALKTVSHPLVAAFDLSRLSLPDAGEHVADDLSTTEFAITMLAARGWTNQEIADHLKLSPNTIKRYISNAMTTLGIRHRQDLKEFMLR